MRASLASATSLLALLLVDSRDVGATTITIAPTTTNSGDVLVGQTGTITDVVSVSGASGTHTLAVGNATIANGISGGSTSSSVSGAAGSLTATFTFAPAAALTYSTTALATFNGGSSTTLTVIGTGVEAAASVTATASAGDVRVGGSSNVTLTVSNTGNGDLAPIISTLNNLNGSTAAGNSIFVGTTSSFSLRDSNGTGGATTQTATYAFKPTSTGLASTTVVTSFTTGGASNAGGAATAITSTLTGTGVAPVYASSTSNTSGSVSLTNANTPSVKGSGTVAGAISSTISLGSVGNGVSKTVYLDIGNITTDAGGSLTNLTIDGYSLTGGNAASFSISSIGGDVITKSGEIEVPITVVGNATIGALNSSLTIFTDENSTLGGSGDNFTYALTGYSTAPEPTSLAVLGVGLAGLASFRRRRKTAA